MSISLAMNNPITRGNLLHLTWDSPDNPWCGGGGAFRDYRILSLLAGWERRICSGQHQKGTLPPKDTVRLDRGIGWLGEFISRRTWARSAGRTLEASLRGDRHLVISQSVSAWAPVWASLEHPDRILHVVHHIAGDSILCRLGPFGPSSLRYEQRILAEGRYFATPNRTTAARIRSLNPLARIEVIPNGFDPPRTAPPSRHSQSDQFRIVFLGRLDHQMKGLDRLLEVFACLSAGCNKFRLVLAGRSDRSMDSWISCALSCHPARDRIEVVRNPSDEEKYRILDSADLFCVPSRFEGWCIAAVEAQSRGLPVVATSTDGLRDSVSDGRTGLLVSNDEGEATSALVEMIRLLADNPQRRLAMGRAAIDWANQFTWEAAATATHTLLDEIRHNSR